jgi:CBS domain-containing protein
MKVADIMTRDVITVAPKTPIHEAAKRLVDHGISGMPVVDESGALVGILSEGDLILRQKPRERIPWWRFFFANAEELAREYQKSAGATVGEVMTREVISISPDLPVDAAAVVLDEHKVRRVPVVSGGRLVGVVSRGDLVKALSKAPSPVALPPSDAELVRQMKAAIAREAWVSNRGIVVQAKDGVIAIWGLVGTEAEKSAIETMARSVPGCRSVQNQLVAQSALPYHYGSV